MYIKSIVLEGFKSYGNRVEITGFDPQFNAITGLNGTGKSNILDSICFVLGITNLSNVRAGSLQELIYKHGQAGITKATVSITFDNRDKSQCPIGYENHDEIIVTRQVVMGGKNKYLINGINVQNKRVSDLFCSVQLNVNNPHFLIMQGRITKVLNMKPPEILSMVEEAAGTRMYEAKKQAAQKTIERKDAKLRELNDIIKEDIAPKLQKLQDERSQFQEYQKVVRELENITKLHTAWKYVKAVESVQETENKLNEVQKEMEDKKKEIKDCEKECEEIEKQIEEATKKLEEESGGVLGQLQATAERLERDELGAAAALGAARDALADQRRRAAGLERALRDDRAALAQRAAERERALAAAERLRAAGGGSGDALQRAQRRFLALGSGQEADESSLHSELVSAKSLASEAGTRASQAALERSAAARRLADLRRDFAARAQRYDKERAHVAERERRLQALDAELAELAPAAREAAALEADVRERAGAAQELARRRDAMAARLSRCQFQYTPPWPDFDRAAVFGPVCRLMEVVDPKYCTALETVAGGKLFHVVVDTDATSKALLQRGNLQSRTTIIPLNKIRGRVVSDDVIAAAQRIDGSVRGALSLARCAARVAPALRWVLGAALVCDTLDGARRVTWARAVRTRCVTLDGDVCDPAGTLAGGAAPAAGSLLQRLAELRALERDADAAERELAAARARARELAPRAERHADALQAREVAAHELAVARARLATTADARTHDEIAALEAQVAELTSAIERDTAVQEEAAARARDLEEKVKDIEGHREREYKKAELELAKAKEEAERHGSQWKTLERELETLALEVSELEQAVASGAQQLEDGARDDERQQQRVLALERDHAAAQAAAQDMQARVKRQKAAIAGRSAAAARLAAARAERARRADALRLDADRAALAAPRLAAALAERRAGVSELRAQHAWIADDEQYFGARGGLYDFEGKQAHAAGARKQALEHTREKLARGLNTRAHALLGKEEEQYQDVVRKKRIVEADRAKLVQVMEELDEKKRRTLVAACEQVNRDFGNIFSALLPGAQARLQPPPGAGVLDGLEVRVGFNSAWKESLGELSGGQRSLVALSLVLSMLLFKPAPLYILDEVDAALDLSHTQNIGIMLKEHFKHSQFIIVSLKDGMFNNANVLFRTRFVDGMSSVQRTINTHR